MAVEGQRTITLKWSDNYGSYISDNREVGLYEHRLILDPRTVAEMGKPPEVQVTVVPYEPVAEEWTDG